VVRYKPIGSIDGNLSFFYTANIDSLLRQLFLNETDVAKVILGLFSLIVLEPSSAG